MKLFILAAGNGMRLWPLTQQCPKSLINLGNSTTILDRQLTAAINSGLFKEIIITTGYKTELIEEKIKRYQQQIPVSIFYNPFYETSNNLISLWLTHHKMLEDDFMITNGDNLYKHDIFNAVCTNTPEIIQVTVDYKEHYDEDDMKVTLNDQHHVLRIHKSLAPASTHAESVGLALIQGQKHRRIFHHKICQMARNKDYLNTFWLEVFNSMIADGITVNIKSIDRDMWEEADFPADIDHLRQLIANGF